MATQKEKEVIEQVLFSLDNYIENTNLSEIDKFVFKQSMKGESDKTFAEWEKIKINIFS